VNFVTTRELQGQTLCISIIYFGIRWTDMTTITRVTWKLCFVSSVCFKLFVTRGTFDREKLHVPRNTMTVSNREFKYERLRWGSKSAIKCKTTECRMQITEFP